MHLLEKHIVFGLYGTKERISKRPLTVVLSSSYTPLSSQTDLASGSKSRYAALGVIAPYRKEQKY